ncbi:MAG TPA: tRNA (adenosine(37)-N6)-threonylcarbamoyltransferase complex ATPase subunit type 1 TsaE [Pyrinomonadaceae bacterium]|nr:tRNA (adenosine(37)-N6)-threonylcarbamoyltransferase complex ATPase subunit type 1 TsaE [Pyrinomonadaceae bacterium]
MLKERLPVLIEALQNQVLLTGHFKSHSPEETFNFGHQLGSRLKGGEILLLSGPLGAGKTIFVKGIASALGIDEEDVTSPSFTLVNPYTGRLRLYHLDLYRLDEGASAAHAVDLEDLLADEESVIVIEWAERMGGYPLPDSVWQIEIAGDGDQPRAISIQPLKQV